MFYVIYEVFLITVFLSAWMPEMCITTALITDPETPEETLDPNSHMSSQQPSLLKIRAQLKLNFWVLLP